MLVEAEVHEDVEEVDGEPGQNKDDDHGDEQSHGPLLPRPSVLRHRVLAAPEGTGGQLPGVTGVLPRYYRGVIEVL